jgi:hypothetical protein
MNRVIIALILRIKDANDNTVTTDEIQNTGCENTAVKNANSFII